MIVKFNNPKPFLKELQGKQNKTIRLFRITKRQSVQQKEFQKINDFIYNS